MRVGFEDHALVREIKDHFEAAQNFLTECPTFAFDILRQTHGRILYDETSELQALQAPEASPVFTSSLYVDRRLDRLHLCEQSVFLDCRSFEDERCAHPVINFE